PLSWPLKSHKEFFRRKHNLDSIVYEIIDQRMNSTEGKEDLLDMFVNSTDIETGEKMNRTQIRDEIFTMLVAGFETSSVALTWVWYNMSLYPEVVVKIIEELDNVVGAGPLQPDHLMKLNYIQQVISETMRMYPPVFALPRDVGEDFELENFLLQKDTPFLISIYGLHHNPAYWPNPKKFDPERFSKVNKENQVKGSYMPFGLGQRICIGSQFAMMEMTALIAVMIKDFAPEPVPGYTPEMIAAITTNVTMGMPMFIKRRRNNSV
ncbi:MAG: cytochrome P450, partial [Bacteroidota bacterium]|nr:cytochrome P450 [Bacteroidota bacterium]MDX5430013.1 cytochrome P450 [Bacteroidota bacterium]MDX5468786.1 cytochrome P450 [Bacteroidota bacterium]